MFAGGGKNYSYAIDIDRRRVWLTTPIHRGTDIAPGNGHCPRGTNIVPGEWTLPRGTDIAPENGHCPRGTDISPTLACDGIQEVQVLRWTYAIESIN